MSAFYSPLRYPGGKTFLLNYLTEIIQINSPIETYIEPFAGGAGASLGLLYQKYVKRVILNDVDEYIYRFWKSVLFDTKRLINKIRKTPINIDEWRFQREILFNAKLRRKKSDLDLGFATFYLNRCNRSGIFMAGPIGGNSQKGKWKLDARFNKESLIERIEKIACHKKIINICNLDALHFLKKHLPKLDYNSKKTLIYLDPPYYEKGALLYRHHFSDKDHIKLNEFLKYKLKSKWILSYDDVPFINELYKDTKKNGISLNHFAYKARVGKELIIASDDCKIPAKQLKLM